MLIIAWAAALFLATRFFGEWEQRQENPNTIVASEHGDGYVEVKLASNRDGHFVMTGQINTRPVQFMLDTGATNVAVPEGVAKVLRLERGERVQVSTANGLTDAFRTTLQRLQIGDIVLSNVRALVVPGLDGDQVLLGMSAVKQLEFTQRSGTLLLRQTKK